MLKTVATAAVLAPVLAFALAGTALAAPDVGQMAPQFDGTDTNGETFSLADYQGQTVILEWTNHGCPYVKKHYETGNMQDLQTAAASDDIVWVSIISSAPGKQGHVDGDQANALTAEREASPARVLLDPDGTIGRLYEAKTTPHMYIIDEEGVLRYMGAIDDQPTARKSSVEGAKNYVTQALADMAAGEPVAEPETTAYGCDVKYAD